MNRYKNKSIILFMANTDPEKFKKGYGEKAYKHAIKEGKEDWTREDEKTKKLRMSEYKERLTKFKQKAALQDVSQLENVNATYTFKKGDTLYPVLTEFYKMNKHTAFFALVRMLENGINVDLWRPDDEITLKSDGTLVAKRKGTEIVIENFLTPDVEKAEKKKSEEKKATEQPKQPEPSPEEKKPTAPAEKVLGETQETAPFNVQPPETQETAPFKVEPPETQETK